jgi:hypothetical protein
MDVEIEEVRVNVVESEQMGTLRMGGEGAKGGRSGRACGREGDRHAARKSKEEITL